MIERRDFLKTIGVGGTAALLDGCSRAPTEKLIPYLVAPDDIVPGVPAYYKTVCRECPAGCGLVATTREGRVIKVEGNPDHPVGAGTLCVRGQASVQSLYDPDRFRGPLERDGQGRLSPATWDRAESTLAARLRDVKARKGGVAWIGRLQTGSLERLSRDWLAALGSDRRLFHETFEHEPLRRAGEIAFGRREVPAYHFDRAQFVLSFGADFLETWISNVEFTAGFARMRRARMADPFGSYVHVGPRLSMTASNADLWAPVPAGAEATFALSLVRAIVDEGLVSDDARPHLPWIRTLVAPVALEAARATTGVAPDEVRALARQFVRAAPSLAIGGGVAAGGDRAVELELAVLLLNVVAGNVGRTVTYGAGSALDGLATYRDLLDLTRDMAAGRIQVLFVHHANPLFTLPAASGFAQALDKVPLVVSFSSVPDETTARAHLVLPDQHFLESWGDYTPRAGLLGVQQPAMRPLADTRATGDVLIEVAKQLDAETASKFNYTDYHNWVMSYWNFIVRPAVAADREWEEFWPAVLTRGGEFSTPAPDGAPALRDFSRGFRREPETVEGTAGGLVLLPYPSAHLFDGRMANDAWLQEIPDPVTKIVWDGWAEIHPDTARRLNVAEGDLVDLQSPHGRAAVALHLSAGVHRDAVAMPIGQGRSGSLRYAANRGANPLVLLSPAPDGEAGSLRWRSVRVSASATGKNNRPIVLQAETRLPPEPGRPGVAEVIPPSLAGVAPPAEHPVDFYPPRTYAEHRWGMAIDLHACTGCNACVAACYAENNVPVVGRELCAEGREMSWIRIERYQWAAPAAGTLERPGIVTVPMLCQQCDEAPCEPVCPVFATYTNPEGLNAQIYNRCVGTRYCSNNCPYKVRRFNFGTYTRPAPLDLQLNPDVTVRTMGVMEKCTFCVQRIAAGKNVAKREGRALRDGEIRPACAQTCPAEAIVFGDLHDPDSRVSRLARDPRGYHVLASLNTRPAITYLKRIAPGAPVPAE